jgi:hypothetical protein
MLPMLRANCKGVIALSSSKWIEQTFARKKSTRERNYTIRRIELACKLCSSFTSRSGTIGLRDNPKPNFVRRSAPSTGHGRTTDVDHP